MPAHKTTTSTTTIPKEAFERQSLTGPAQNGFRDDLGRHVDPSNPKTNLKGQDTREDASEALPLGRGGERRHAFWGRTRRKRLAHRLRAFGYGV